MDNSERDGNTRPPDLPLEKLYAGQEATVGTAHGTTDWFQIGKGICQGCILPPCLFNLYAEYIMRNAGLEEAQAAIKIAGRNSNNLTYANDTTLMTEREEELKSRLMKVKEESKKVGLKLNIQKTKIMEKEMANHSSYYCLRNPIDRGAWWSTVHRVARKKKKENKQTNKQRSWHWVPSLHGK